jgi:hypothetical protein
MGGFHREGPQPNALGKARSSKLDQYRKERYLAASHTFQADIVAQRTERIELQACKNRQRKSKK